MAKNQQEQEQAGNQDRYDLEAQQSLRDWNLHGKKRRPTDSRLDRYLEQICSTTPTNQKPRSDP